MQNWHLLYTTLNIAEANIIKGLLEENDVLVYLMNKQDSSYLNFGEIQVYVPTHLKDISQQLVQQRLSN